jgi:flagellar protein FlaI
MARDTIAGGVEAGRDEERALPAMLGQVGTGAGAGTGAGLPAVRTVQASADRHIDAGTVTGASGDGGSLREAVLTAVHRYFDERSADPAFVAPPDAAFVDERFFDFSFLEGATGVEHYWVQEPYAFVSILREATDDELRYHVAEPVLDPFERYVLADLTRTLRNNLLYRDIDRSDDRRAVFTREAKAALVEHAATVDSGSLHKILYYLVRDFVDFGRVDPIMRDPAVEDVSCDGDGVPVFVYHADRRDLRTNVVFDGPELTSFTVRLAQRAGKQVSISEPLVDASLPDGSRVQLTLGTDISTRGSNFTIRKFSETPFTPVDLIEWNTFSVEEMAYFWLAIENNRSLVFAGGTGSGKTTSLNAISLFVPGNSKVVSIEDTREITLPHDNWIQSVTRDSFAADGRGEVSMYELLQAALRQRPEYLLVGEIRTEQRVALTFFHAIATGHTAYTTVHADSVEGVINRMRNEPLNVPASMLADLDVVSIQRQIHLDGGRVRRNLAIAELDTADGGVSIDTTSVFERDARTDGHQRVGDSPMLAGIAAERGWDEAELARQLDARERVLRGMLEGGVRDYREVAARIHAFTKDPEAVLADLDATVETDLVATDGDAAADGATDAEGGPDPYSVPVAGFDMSVFDRPAPDATDDGDVADGGAAGADADVGTDASEPGTDAAAGRGPGTDADATDATVEEEGR